jgi:hypothetical protein
MVLLGEYLCSRNEMRDIPLYTPLSVLEATTSTPKRDRQLELREQRETRESRDTRSSPAKRERERSPVRERTSIV